MLTRDLLRHTLRQGRIYPRFIDVDNQLTLNLAEELTAIYQCNIGLGLDELTELTQPIINGHRTPLVAKGLNKLLLDRCQFREADAAIGEARLAILERATHLLRQPNMGDLEHYRRMVAEPYGPDPDQIAGRLYADLPIRQPLEAFDPPTPEALLQRYNLAQAQGLLFFAQAVTLTLRESRVVRLRRFFQYLRFFRLLFRILRTGEHGYRMRLDGPLSLFDGHRKYGFQLALALPAFCDLEAWNMEAEVRIPGHAPVLLVLDEKSPLRSHYARLTGYHPREFQVFNQQFQEQAPPGWTMAPEADILQRTGQEVWIPDWTFVAPNHALIHVELFHRWHASLLESRLESLEQTADPPLLVLGVDRFLYRDLVRKARLDGSRWFADHGFLFNEFPPVERVLKCLLGYV
ncbi:MAG: DUF790 family protein [Magnetococcales bacterium]|nr:DUF790 family protein [Magnetococcales bacterium]MBF0322696.1 DUF790 family protein [Magnetococcales bacterium]